MLVKTRGVVLRVLKYGDSGVICDLLTEHHGLISYLGQGVRSAKSRNRTILLRPGTIVEIVAYHREDKSLQRLTEVKADYVYREIPFDLARGAVSLFMAELVQKTIRYSEAESRLFHFVRDSFIFLDSTSKGVGNFHLAFALQLTFFLGFAPQVPQEPGEYLFDLREGVFVPAERKSTYTLSPAQSNQLTALLRASFENVHQVILKRQERQDLLIQLVDYYRLHLPNFKGLQSHTILFEVLG